LGVARDTEVLAERYERELSRLDATLIRGPVWERLVNGARRRYQTGHRRSLVAMRSKRYFRLLDTLEAMVTERPVSTVDGEPKPVTIDAAYRRVRKATKAAARAEAAAAAKADSDTDTDTETVQDAGDVQDADEALHRIRKRAKQLRYTAAATGANQVSEQAKAIQSLLGDHQDSVVSREHLLAQAQAAHLAGEDTFTYGLLYQLESQVAESSRQQLDSALSKLDKAVRDSRR
jgi:CHAD domain-containing protein